MIKLSKAQERVIELMKNGWELCTSSCFGGEDSVWLQKNGCGKGGETEKVNYKTYSSLIAKGLIIEKNLGFPTSSYQLKKDEEKGDEQGHSSHD